MINKNISEKVTDARELLALMKIYSRYYKIYSKNVILFLEDVLNVKNQIKNNQLINIKSYKDLMRFNIILERIILKNDSISFLGIIGKYCISLPEKASLLLVYRLGQNENIRNQMLSMDIFDELVFKHREILKKLI